MTNILQLPLFEAVIETHSNERARTSFLVQTGDPPADLALAGIAFKLQLRTAAKDRNVHLEASTTDSRLTITGATLGVDIPRTVMAALGEADYVFDIVATADGIERRFMYGTWRHRIGVTKP
ncbi:hypothetical protein PQJ75_24625 [Rhodoplanes sp. TEM]|uniref:Uncharacterized protein n=1 Tax=Rhodoplanes tepidamans TaxID=200616 RepID=A0ABT5JEV0_RHOTP|nr:MULTISPECIES: hypothetical protein [Rhodoplanes]MDC7787953.1 hypothetical protein [Rhodoplanes tepidamans]MDC7986927.1 hypothetical protein [Rhodoplanes sp. TEM]MDQ0358382.1 hypothetical protein [Rhodoplanes tepidamans]